MTKRCTKPDCKIHSRPVDYDAQPECACDPYRGRVCPGHAPCDTSTDAMIDWLRLFPQQSGVQFGFREVYVVHSASKSRYAFPDEPTADDGTAQ